MVSSSAPASSTRGTLLATFCIVLALWLPLSARSNPGAGAQAIGSLRNATISREGNLTTVVLEADAPLPWPATGTVDNPPRVFLDFPGLDAKPRQIASDTDPLVRRVRIALNSATPRIARVVIDLSTRADYRMQVDPDNPRRLRIVLREGPAAAARSAGAPDATTPVPSPNPQAPIAPAPVQPPQTAPTSSAAAPPSAVPALPSGPPTPTPEPKTAPASPPTGPPAAAPLEATPNIPSSPPPSAPAARPGEAPEVQYVPNNAPPPPRKDVERYLSQMSGVLDRLSAVKWVLTTLDARSQTVDADALQKASAELQDVHRALSSAKPSDAMRVTHDLLLRASTLGYMAVRLRLDPSGNEPAAITNAGSAAAGAILLLDRALKDLSYSPRSSR